MSALTWQEATDALYGLTGAPLRDDLHDLHVCAAELGLELAPVTAGYDDLAIAIASAPSLLRTCEGWLAVTSAGRLYARLVTPHGRRRVRIHVLTAMIEAQLQRSGDAERGGLEGKVSAALSALPKRLAQDEAVRRAFVSKWATGRLFEIGFLVRRPVSHPLMELSREVSLIRNLVWTMLAQGIRLLLLFGTWWIVGRGALSGKLDLVGFLLWVFVLLTGLPIRTLLSSLHGELAIGLGLLLQQRLYAGVLAVHPDEVRQDGIGWILGRVYEGWNWQQHVITSVIGAGIAAVEFALAVWMLWMGVSGALLVALLLSWTALALTVGSIVRYRAQAALVRARLQLTARLVESMTGHRTRMIQEPIKARHRAEDHDLSAYTALAQRYDQIRATIEPWASHGWRICALLAIAAHVVSGAEVHLLALTVGGILFAETSLRSLLAVAADLVSGAVAWREIGHLYRAAADLPSQTSPPYPGMPGILRLHGVGFRYPGDDRFVVRDIHWQIGPNDRILLSGASGSGKSTLAAMLTALRTPTEGTLLLDGLDLQTVGTRTWRRRVVYVPQFHLNHILSETMAFNVLMGKTWPPHPADIELARRICADLGLGPLLARMPGGLMQMIGDGGWQLSHGERARLFLARALAMHPAVLVIDESFGAMDPITLDQVLGCIERRSAALVVIAHP